MLTILAVLWQYVVRRTHSHLRPSSHQLDPTATVMSNPNALDMRSGSPDLPNFEEMARQAVEVTRDDGPRVIERAPAPAALVPANVAPALGAMVIASMTQPTAGQPNEDHTPPGVHFDFFIM